MIIQSINKRFKQDDLALLMTIEQILVRSMMERGFPIDDLMHPSIDREKLRVQLDDLPTVIYNVDRKKKIASVSRISTIAEIFNSFPTTKQQCSKVDKMIKLYYTVPFTSSTCERTVSAMWRLKTWLRANTG